jgi:hypothetical protein
MFTTKAAARVNELCISQQAQTSCMKNQFSETPQTKIKLHAQQRGWYAPT